MRNETVNCPYCGELIEVMVDPSVPEQQYIEDCSVCCHPIEFRVICADDEVTVTAERST